MLQCWCWIVAVNLPGYSSGPSSSTTQLVTLSYGPESPVALSLSPVLVILSAITQCSDFTPPPSVSRPFTQIILTYSTRVPGTIAVPPHCLWCIFTRSCQSDHLSRFSNFSHCPQMEDFVPLFHLSLIENLNFIKTLLKIMLCTWLSMGTVISAVHSSDRPLLG